MLNPKKLFFIAVVPHEQLQEGIREIKLDFRERYGSGHALNSPAHLTLIPPFYWPMHQVNELMRSMDIFCREEIPFEVRLDNFGAFPPRVIYIDVVKNENLTGLYERLKVFMDVKWNIRERLHAKKPFNPHMTIAFRDLTREYFKQAWAEFKNKPFKEVFLVDKIVLLIHQQKYWEIQHQAYFGKK
jgi:2'-5' RNA ligase